MIKRGLDPECNRKTEILIVGTFPSIESLKIENRKYYHNPTNQFWRLMSDILNIKLETMTYENKIKKLLENKIGLWDTIYECERKTSSDKDIRKKKFNNFKRLKCPRLRVIFANSQEAFDYLKKCKIPPDVSTNELISSSKQRMVKYGKKKRNWKKILLWI